jgi:hypothetical protein
LAAFLAAILGRFGSVLGRFGGREWPQGLEWPQGQKWL